MLREGGEEEGGHWLTSFASAQRAEDGGQAEQSGGQAASTDGGEGKERKKEGSKEPRKQARSATVGSLFPSRGRWSTVRAHLGEAYRLECCTKNSEI